MASSGWYDSAGLWHEPNDPAPGRQEAPANPSGGGYTVPTPAGGPDPNAPAPAPPPVVTPPGVPPTVTPPTWNPPSYNGPMSPDTSWLKGAPAFNAPVFQAPPAFAYDAFKQPDPFKAPAPFVAPQFAAPDVNAVLADPGYQLRRDEGAQAVRQAASSMGKLRTGGTIKDLINFNQNFASREYGNVYDRNLGAYKTNYDTSLGAYNTNYETSLGSYKTNYDNLWNAYQGNYNTAADVYKTNFGVSRDVFDRTYQGAKDMYQPQLLTWQTQQQAAQRASELEYQRQFDLYKYQNPSATDIFSAGAPR